MYAFHALCLLPVVFLAVGLLGLAAPLAKVVDVPLAGLTAEWIALAVYGVVLVLLVPWVGIVVRLSRRPGTDPRD
jgi:membrane protein implicated in regulation of membrane protease activity